MKKLKINQHELQALVANIARKILLGSWKPDYIVGIVRGGLTPALLLSHYLNIPMHTLNVSLRDHEEGESNLWMAEDALGPNLRERLVDDKHGGTHKNILLVDDINDQGTTLNWIMKDWRSGCFPNDPSWDEVWNNNVRFAVLVDNLASACDVKMDYAGMEINKAEDPVWVDFPWEDWWTK
jgi:hypoxanthine phosphoribosyltransferase